MKVKQIQSEEKAFIKFLENKGVARSIVFGQRPYMRDEKFSEGDVMEAAILDKDLSIIYSEAPAFVRGEFTKAFTKALKTHKCDKSRMNTNTNFEELISSLMVSSSLEHMSTYQTFSLDGGLKDKIKNYEIEPDSEEFKALRHVVSLSHHFFSSAGERRDYNYINLEWLTEKGIRQVEKAQEFVKTCSLTPIQDAFKVWLDSIGPNNFTPITKGCAQPVMKEIRDTKKERPELDEKTKAELKVIARKLREKK
jgi:hypothetical protein